MLGESEKQLIQQSYSEFLQNRGLTARYGQKLMVAAVARTLGGVEENDEGERVGGGHICVVEAGTGTGKTVAYLLPALILARALGKKLVVATATVALQEQIVNKDLPELKRNTNLSFNFSLAKGRGRYLCLSKLDNLLGEFASAADPNRALYEDELPQVDAQGIKLYDSMMEALAANKWDGERDSWPVELAPEDWQRVTTDHRQCTGRRCSNIASCAFFKARDSMHKVDCIVTNHDLVLADLALGGGAILPEPEETIYVFDEGHHLPDKALNHFACHGRVLGTSRWLEQCNKGLGAVLSAVGEAGRVNHLGERLPAMLMETKQQLDVLYPLLSETLQSAERSDRDQRQQYRFAGGVVPESIAAPAAELYQSFDRLADILGKITAELASAMEDMHCPVPKVDLETQYPLLGSWQARAEANRDLWQTYALADNEAAVPRARWLTLVEFGGSVDIEVCSSPILAARTLAGSLWQRAYAAVVTSATLTALGSFDRYRMRAGTPEDAHYEAVPSSFDFSRALLQIPRFAEDAGRSDEHTRSLVTHLPELIAPQEGTLVLYSSRRQMLDVFEQLPETLRERILVQGDRSRQEILDRHRQRLDKGEGSVIFGLASFAEGVDLPGHYCNHVIIAKLPFAVPDDPIEASVAEWIEARGGNSFMQMAVPDASLKLIQACGRLLRTEEDTGTITLLDRRLITRRYGKAILDSLPAFTRRIDV